MHDFFDFETRLVLICTRSPGPGTVQYPTRAGAGYLSIIPQGELVEQFSLIIPYIQYRVRAYGYCSATVYCTLTAVLYSTAVSVQYTVALQYPYARTRYCIYGIIRENCSTSSPCGIILRYPAPARVGYCTVPGPGERVQINTRRVSKSKKSCIIYRLST